MRRFIQILSEASQKSHRKTNRLRNLLESEQDEWKLKKRWRPAPINMAAWGWRCGHMGLITKHRGNLGCEGSYQSLYSQNSSCPVATGSIREKQTQNVDLSSLSLPSLPAVCLPSPPSIYISAVRWPLTDPTTVTCLFTHGEWGGHRSCFGAELHSGSFGGRDTNTETQQALLLQRKHCSVPPEHKQPGRSFQTNLRRTFLTFSPLQTTGSRVGGTLIRGFSLCTSIMKQGGGGWLWRA